ncbi:MAG TPA: type II toxin-antitoxin system VapC family toxin [Candidatus Limnocylindrales bacterium]|nr:type II toxin-antitoxin system VapC family toxin [Candidatus Limnocylindrales bacterium]
MRVLIDTIAFVMGVKFPERLSRSALHTMQNTDVVRELSAVSLTEIATKAAIGRLKFTREDVLQGVADLQLRLLPFTPDHAWGLFDLPLHHRDPFDRQIIAQALAEKIPVVTCDQQFRLYKALTVIW